MSFGKLGAMGRGFGHLGALGSVGIAPETLALVAAMTTPPTPARLLLINSLVVALKGAGLWQLFDALYLTAAADPQAATLNWINPATFTLVPTGSPTFTADRGFTGNGSTAYLATNYVPSVNAVKYTTNAAHISGWSLSTGAASATERLIGNVAATTGRTVLIVRNTGDVFAGLLNDATGTSFSNANRDGHFIMNHSAQFLRQAYRNGASIGNDTQGNVGLPTTAVTFLRDTGNFATMQIACGSMGGSLSSTQAAAFYSAINTYLQSIGAV